MSQKRVMGLDAFRNLVQSVKDISTIKTEDLVLISYQQTASRALSAEECKSMGKSTGLIEFTITTDRLDRDQDTISADGWEFKDFQKNPVVLWCHDHYSMPVGRSLTLGLGGNSVKSTCEFTPKDLNPFGYMVYRMYAEGFLNAVSVGMQPMEYSIAADRKYGLNYTKQSLLEYSAVPVPANPDALAVARSKGIDMTPMYDWASQLLDEKSGMSDDARHRTEILRSMTSPSGRALFLDLGDMKMAGKSAPETPPAENPAVVKQVTRWDCGEKSHSHETEPEATACASFDVAITDATKSLQQLLALKKGGRTIKTESAALIRSVVDELVPPAAAAAGVPAKKEGDTPEGEADPATGDEEKSINLGDISEAQLGEMIQQGVTASFNRATGRVD